MYDESWLRRRAMQSAPLEACGFIFDDGSIVEIRNVATDPRKSFKMDLVQANQKISGKKVYAIWHTHPSGSVKPSKDDIMAMNSGHIRPHWKYLIVSATEISEIDVNSFAPQDDSFWNSFIKENL